nr:carboxyl terminal PDZ ligand of neuronal nitric [Hymenolepis microstoma]
MPFRRSNYDFMLDDGLDTRIPVYSDEVFKHGIHFCCKFIGAMEVPRPQNRLEIVSSMRRIRYEFKAKGVKKQKALIKVSADGVFVYGRNKSKVGARLSSALSRISGSSTPVPMEIPTSKSLEGGGEGNTANNVSPTTAAAAVSGGLLGLGLRNPSALSCVHPSNVILYHPIYRIFYVSHDSQDLKIFSYIARDGKSSCFKCYVFKAYKKLQAMRIVRTVGQAFDVCHRLALQKQENDPNANKKNDENRVIGDTGSFHATSPHRRKSVTRNNRSHSSHLGENSSDENDWRGSARRRRQSASRKKTCSSDDDQEINEHDERARSVIYSEEGSDEDLKKPLAPLTLKKVKKASGRRRRRNQTSSDEGDASSDSSDLPRRHLKSHMKQSITNDDFFTWGQFGHGFGYTAPAPMSIFGLPQSQSLDTNLARDILCGSSTHSIQSQSSIPPDPILLTRLLSELQGTLTGDQSVASNEKTRQSDSLSWVPHLGGRSEALSETHTTLSRQLDLLEANMIKTCKNDLRSISSYQLSKEASSIADPVVGISNSITTPNLASTSVDGSKTDGKSPGDITSALSAETLDILKRQLNIQEAENKIALFQIHRLMRQLKLEAAARMEGQYRIEQLLSQNRNLSEGFQEMAFRLKRLKNLSPIPSATSEKGLYSTSKAFNGISGVRSPGASSHLPQSATFSASKSEGFSRLAELDVIVQNMLTPSTSARRDSLRNVSSNSPRHNKLQHQLSLGAGMNSPKLPSLSPLQNNRNGNANNNNVNEARFSGTDNSSSPGGSNSQSLPLPLKMPYRGSEGEDGFLELATRSTAPVEGKVATCSWVDECFGMGADNQTAGKSSTQASSLPFEPFRGQEELSDALLPPTPPARVHPAVNGGNPWAGDIVNKATGGKDDSLL